MLSSEAAVLNFDEASHAYTVDGIDYPSITTVIEAAGLVDYSMIPIDELAFYQQRGTALHQACWFDDEGDLDESTVDPEVMTRLAAWRKLRREMPFTVVLSEVRRFDRVYGYAGTPDRLVKLPNGERGVIELKSGPLQTAVRIQTAAQAHLFEPQGGRLRRFAAHLRGDGTYSVKEFPVSELRADLSVFLSALSVYKFRKANL